MRRRETRRLTRIQAVYTQATFAPTLSKIEALWKLKQMRNLSDDSFFGGLKIMVKMIHTKAEDFIL